MKIIEKQPVLLNSLLHDSLTFYPCSQRLPVWRDGLRVAKGYQKHEWRRAGGGWEAGETFQISEQTLMVDGGKCMPCIAPGKHLL